jgi:hypothetical protein
MSIRKFGLIFILGLFLLSIGISAIGATVVEVTFVGIQNPSSTHRGEYWYNGAFGMWDGTGQEIGTAGYTELSTLNNVVYSSGGSGYGYAAYQTYYFDIAAVATANGFSLADIDEIKIYYEGYGYC